MSGHVTPNMAEDGSFHYFSHLVLYKAVVLEVKFKPSYNILIYTKLYNHKNHVV